jgi:cell division protein FtsQ
MVSVYPTIARALEPLADPLAELRHSPRGGWQVALESGLVLELGRGDFESRIARFVSAHPHLETQGLAPRHADLRYPNGFAVRRVAKAPEKGAAR